MKKATKEMIQLALQSDTSVSDAERIGVLKGMSLRLLKLRTED